MRLQYASDLHIERWLKATFEETLEPVAPVLVLLGDICPLDHTHTRPFFEWCSERWETVLWIPGNLEVWGSGFTAVEPALQRMRQLVSPYMNCHVLYRDTMASEDGFLILACSLWTRPRDVSDTGMLRVTDTIWAKPEPCPTAERVFLDEYVRCLTWLKEQLRDTLRPTVVLTHYAPVPWLFEEEWIQDKRRSVRLYELEQLLKPPVTTWLYGHSHVPNIEYATWNDSTGRESSILLTANPRGYPRELRGVYRKDAVVRVDPSRALDLIGGE